MLLILSLYERSIIYSVNGTFEDASSITIQFQWALLRNTRKEIYIDGFHSDVIKLQSQKSQVLRICIYTRLKTNRK